MKHWDLAAAFLLFLGIGLGVYLERPAPADTSAFGAEMALSPALAPLEAPGGALALHGGLRTAAGDPAEEAFLVLLRSEDDPSEAEPLYHAYTDAEGRFAFGNLTPGTFRVLITHPSAPPKSLELELTESQEVAWTLAPPLEPLPVLPEIRRRAVAGRIRLPETLAAGSTALADFEVALVPVAEEPLLSGATTRRASTDGEGRFRLEEVVLAGYRVEVLPPWAHGGSWPVLGGRTWKVTTEAEELELTLAVGELEGELQEASGGRPLVGALVRVSALDALDPIGQPELWPPRVTDASGHFRIELLPPGRYRVHLRAGLAVSDVEVVVENERRTLLPIGHLDQRVAEPPTGG